jgi:hypothetical protein
VQVVLVAIVLLVVAVRLPFTVRSDVRGVEADAKLSARAVAEARGPAAAAGTNIVLLRAAQAHIPRGADYAILRGGKWGTAEHPNRSEAFVWESGESWTQYDLAPRIEVAPSQARWLLIRDARPDAVGVGAPMHSWRFGNDWLIEEVRP